MKRLPTFSFIFATLFVSTIRPVQAHVGYVLTNEEFAAVAGPDFSYLMETLKQPLHLALMVGTIILVAIAYYASLHVAVILKELNFIRKEAESYQHLVGWMLRLSLGIALIGAGTTQTLISPVLPSQGLLPLLQILIGFLLMTGFLLSPATLAIIPLYLYALITNPYLLGNFELFAAALALLIVAEGEPGIDDLTGIPFVSPLKKLRSLVPLVLRLGIGTAMIYLALFEKLLNPHTSELVAMNYKLTEVIPVGAAMWVLSAGLIEAAVGVLLLIGLRTRVTAAIAVVVLSLSFFYFNEDVYSHITLFGVLSVLFVTGGGRLSLDQIIDPYFHLKIRPKFHGRKN